MPLLPRASDDVDGSASGLDVYVISTVLDYCSASEFELEQMASTELGTKRLTKRGAGTSDKY